MEDERGEGCTESGGGVSRRASAAAIDPAMQQLMVASQIAASQRGHKLLKWKRASASAVRGACPRCGESVMVIMKSQHDGVDVSVRGEVIASGCR